MSHQSMATTWWFYLSKRIRIEEIRHRAPRENAKTISVISANRKSLTGVVSCISFNRDMTPTLWIPRWTARNLSSKLTRSLRLCQTLRIPRLLIRIIFRFVAIFKIPIEMTKKNSPKREDWNYSISKGKMGHTFYRILILRDSPCRISRKGWRPKEQAMQLYQLIKVARLPSTLTLALRWRITSTMHMKVYNLTQWPPWAKRMRT